MRRIQLMAVLAVGMAVTSTMTAQTWNKKTKVRFSGPVQIPAPHTSAGVMVLSAGSYIFKLVDSESDRHIVQVTDTTENKVYSTILAINDYRLNATSKTVMYFSERKAGAPQAIKSWFYPGDNFGQRFIYPKVHATTLAAAVNQPVPSYVPPPQPQPQVIEKIKVVQVPVYIQTPAKAEVAYTPQVLEKHDATDSAGEEGQAVKTEAPSAGNDAPAKLPKTASPMFGYGLVGSLLLGSSLLVRTARKSLRRQ